MKVLLVCAAGMSTSLLTNNMKKVAQPDESIDALPVSDLASNVDKYDVVLLGPQIRFKEKEVKAVCDPKGIPCAVMDMRAYGMMDGKAAMDQALKLFASK